MTLSIEQSTDELQQAIDVPSDHDSESVSQLRPSSEDESSGPKFSASQSAEDSTTSDPQQAASKAQICFDFTKGLCTRGDKCKYSHDLATIVQFNSKERGICFDYLRSQCHRGLLCRFSHDISNIAQQCQVYNGASTRSKTNAICYDFVKGVCQRGNDCRYSHDLGLIAQTARSGSSNMNRPDEVCYDYLRGRCIRGVNCRYSHTSSALPPNNMYGASMNSNAMCNMGQGVPNYGLQGIQRLPNMMTMHPDETETMLGHMDHPNSWQMGMPLSGNSAAALLSNLHQQRQLASISNLYPGLYNTATSRSETAVNASANMYTTSTSKSLALHSTTEPSMQELNCQGHTSAQELAYAARKSGLGYSSQTSGNKAYSNGFSRNSSHSLSNSEQLNMLLSASGTGIAEAFNGLATQMQSLKVANNRSEPGSHLDMAADGYAIIESSGRCGSSLGIDATNLPQVMPLLKDIWNKQSHV